jgi:hypothetical protein
MIILIHSIHLAIKKVYVHRCLLEQNFDVWLEITDNSRAVLLAIIIEPAVFLLLLKIIIAPLSGQARDLCLLLEESDKLYDGSI